MKTSRFNHRLFELFRLFCYNKSTKQVLTKPALTKPLASGKD